MYCINCGEPLPFGRPDRKFCSAGCKNRWHNRRKYPDMEMVERRIFRILTHNHEVLDKLLRLGLRSMDIITLANLGFNQDYSTAYKKVGKHDEYACFDIHYQLTPSRIKKIVRIGLEDDADKKKAGEAAGL